MYSFCVWNKKKRIEPVVSHSIPASETTTCTAINNNGSLTRVPSQSINGFRASLRGEALRSSLLSRPKQGQQQTSSSHNQPSETLEANKTDSQGPVKRSFSTTHAA